MEQMLKTTNPGSFFRLMISPTMQLRLPETFTSAFGDELAETCHLTVPTGETHQVVLVKENNKLCFQDGWTEFVERFSIGYGYFMTFTYDGNSIFKVNLFDLTACEISYQSDKSTCSPVQDEPHHDDICPEFSDEFDNNDIDYVGLENLHSPSASDKNSDGDVNELGSEDDELKSVESISDTRDESEGSPFEFAHPVKRRLYAKEMKYVAAAGISLPENPFFVISIKPYAIRKGFTTIPKGFVSDHLDKCKAWDSIKLEMSDGRQWVVRCTRSGSRCSFGKRWGQFARQNCLDVGDVCLFELTDDKNWVFKVYIVKTSQNNAARRID